MRVVELGQAAEGVWGLLYAWVHGLGVRVRWIDLFVRVHAQFVLAPSNKSLASHVTRHTSRVTRSTTAKPRPTHAQVTLEIEVQGLWFMV